MTPQRDPAFTRGNRTARLLFAGMALVSLSAGLALYALAEWLGLDDDTARYLATAVGGLRYPMMLSQRRSLLGVKPGEKGAVSTSIKEGGDQIEYEDQDPRIHQIWLEEMKKNGVEPKMDKFFPAESRAA